MRRNDMLASQQVVEQMKVVQAQVEERETQTIYGLLHAANLVDPALSRRMVKVASVAAKIALRADALGAEDARRFGIAARVYDIGMLALPANLRERRMELAGPDAGKLLGPHVQRANEVFAKERSGLIELAATIARQHHERFDGRGYPDGLAGHDISIYAQLVAVAEMFNDVVTTGPYVGGGGRSQPLTEPQALAYIDRQSGTTFDPEVIDGLRRVIEAPMAEPPIPVRA
jgi:putative two-component system response regulator